MEQKTDASNVASEARLISGDPSKGLVQVRRAREHNLRNVDLDIPRDALVVAAAD